MNTDPYIVFDPQGNYQRYIDGITHDYKLNSYAYAISTGTWFIMPQKEPLYPYNSWKRINVNKVPKKYRTLILILI